jgi:probable F420-dependent oxidoreductase
MPRQRPFRFGAGLFTAPDRQTWVEQARRIEAYGYDTLLIADHLIGNLAPSLGLLAAANVTTTLRVGCTVFDNDFRHPAILANEVATLDVLTEGRSEFGIGAGWFKPEYDATGIPFDPPGTRVERMIEAVSIIKRLWSGAEVHHNGTHYTIAGLISPLRPVQQPHPPIFIGGGGKRLLSFAAREADTVGILAKARPEGGGEFGIDETEASIARKVAWVREAAGERIEHIELAMFFWAITIADDRRAAAEEIARSTGRVTAEQALASPYYPIGSVDSIVEHLIELRERYGISYFSVLPNGVDAFAPVVARLKGQ